MAGSKSPDEAAPAPTAVIRQKPPADFGMESTVNRAAIEGSGGTPEELPEVDTEAYLRGPELARGGAGRIVAAIDRRLRRSVAIKELLGDRQDAAQRFVREALVTARLQHPSVVPIYEAGRWPSGQPFYAMKLVSGKSLGQLLQGARTLEDRLAFLPSVVAIADAIAYAHSEGVIHRDLKPANAMVGAFGETIVIDWGLAKDRKAAEVPSSEDASAGSSSGGGETVAGAVLGTPVYMPPEQARGEPVDERADVYALGGILYHLLTGAAPYAGVLPDRALERVRQGPPTPLEERVAGVPPELSAIAEKAMARDPGDRYPSARELAADLRRFQTGQLVSVARYSLVALAGRWVRRHAAAVGVAVAAAVMLVVLGAVGVSRIVEQRNEAERGRRQARAAQELAEHRAEALVLLQARAALDADPTASVAWLRTLAPDVAVDEVREIAGDALSRGVARHVIKGHDSLVRALFFEPDSRSLISGGQDGRLIRIDLARGSQQQLAQARGGLGMSTTPDGRLLAVGDYEGRIVVVPAAGGMARLVGGGVPPFLAVALSPDGRHVAGCDVAGTVRVYPLEGDETPLILPGHTAEVRALAYDPGGTHLYTAGFDGTLRQWDLTAGAGRVVVRQRGALLALATSADGTRLATASDDGTVGLFDAARGAARVLPVSESEVHAVALSPDGARLATGDRAGTLRLFSFDGEPLEEHVAHEGGVRKLVFSPDGETLASGGSDRKIRLWRFRESRLGLPGVFSRSLAKSARSLLPDAGRLASVGLTTALCGHEEFVSQLSFSPSGDWLASAGQDGTVRLWPVADGARRVTGMSGAVGAAFVVAGFAAGGAAWRFDVGTGEGRPLGGGLLAEARARALSPDGRLLAVVDAGRDVTVFDLASGAPRPLGRLATDGLAITAAGGRVAVAGTDGTVVVWDLATGERREWRGHQTYALAVSLTADGQVLASAGADRVVLLWDPVTGVRRSLPLQPGPVHHLIWSAGGDRLATGDNEGNARLVDVASGEALAGHQHRGNVQSLALTPDAEGIASGGNDRIVRVSRIGGRELALVGHDQPVLAVAFSRDGRLLASGSADRTVRVWDLQTGVPRVVRGHTDQVLEVGFAPGGQTLWSAGLDGVLRFAPVSDLLPLPAEPAALRAALGQMTSFSIPDRAGAPAARGEPR